MVSAQARASHLMLAQVKVEDKSNKIPALPELLHQVAIKGCVVTIDAMGYQQESAEQIVVQEADYVLALKANQPDLLKEVMDCFSQAQADGLAGGRPYDAGDDRQRTWAAGTPSPFHLCRKRCAAIGALRTRLLDFGCYLWRRPELHTSGVCC